MTTKQASKLSELVGLLYESALDERLWPGMAAKLAQAFDAPSAVLKIDHHQQASADILQVTDNFAIATSDPAWAEHWHRHDLWVQETAWRKLTGAVTSQSLMPDAKLMHTDFYNEWLRPLMIHTGVGALVPMGADGTGVIGVHRPSGSAHFDQHDANKLNALIPHIQQALRLRQHLHSAQSNMLALDQALEAARLAIVALDHEARLLFANALAEAILQADGPLQVTAGRVRARRATDDAELQHLIKINSQQKPGGQQGGAMRVGQGGPTPLTLSFVPLRARAHELSTLAPATLLLIRSIHTPAETGAETLKQLFALTPSEARVAMALAQGHGLEDIATLTRTGLGTVRTHLKSAMAKTGTRRQSQLVALVWHSVGPLPLHLEKSARE